jgi:hypothetical protein
MLKKVTHIAAYSILAGTMLFSVAACENRYEAEREGIGYEREGFGEREELGEREGVYERDD